MQNVTPVPKRKNTTDALRSAPHRLEQTRTIRTGTQSTSRCPTGSGSAPNVHRSISASKSMGFKICEPNINVLEKVCMGLMYGRRWNETYSETSYWCQVSRCDSSQSEGVSGSSPNVDRQKCDQVCLWVGSIYGRRLNETAPSTEHILRLLIEVRFRDSSKLETLKLEVVNKSRFYL